MRKVLIGVLAVVVLLVAAVVAIPWIVPLETWKEQARSRVQAATGRDLTIGGDVRLSIFPAPRIEMENVAFANTPGAERADMARLENLRLQVALMPLVSGEIQIDEFVLIEPDVLLEIDADGRPNWVFGDPAGTETVSGTETAPRSQAGDGRGMTPSDLRLGDVRIENGRFTFVDRRSGIIETVEGVDLTVAMTDLASPFSARGNLTWNDEVVGISADVATPRALTERGSSGVVLGVSADPVELSFDGSVDLGGDAPAVAGQVTLDTPSLRELARWTGNPVELEGEVLGPFSLSGRLESRGTRIVFDEASFTLDDVEAGGRLQVETGGARPLLIADLTMPELDLDPYLAAMGTETTDETADAAPSGEAANGAQPGMAEEGWSREPIDVSALEAADLDVALRVGRLRGDGFEVQDSAVQVRLDDRELVAELLEMSLYGGTGSGRVTLDARGEVPEIANTLRFEGVNAEPLLAAAADFERLEGAGDIRLDATTRGVSQYDMVQALDGEGAFAFHDGAIKGINLAAMVRNVGSAFLDPEAGQARATDFSELSGTFTIREGILRNDDLRMQSPLIRLGGAGSVDLPARTLDYRVEPRAAATIEGQGGREDVAGILVPVIVRGPWDDLEFRPDLAGILRQDPSGALRGLGDQAEGVRERIREGADPADAVRGLLGGGDGDDDDGNGGVEDTIRGLFGR